MRPRIGADKIAKVLKLLRIGKSHREIERLAGVSRPVIIDIANGNRGDGAMQFSESRGTINFQPVEPYECPGCNRIVNTAPCVACTSRRGA